MLRRLFNVLQGLTLSLPLVIFFTYIIADEGDQWTAEHFLATGIFSVPFIIVLLIKYVIYDASET